MSSQYTIPQTLDDPMKIIIFTIDEFLSFLIPFLILGFVFDAIITGFLVGSAGVFCIKKIKGEQGHYFLMNLMYWYLPPKRYRLTPASHRRFFIG